VIAMSTSNSETEIMLDRLFGIDGLSFDLYEGTIVDPGDERAIFLSTDILRGIHAALSYEAGEAWKLVLERCGLLWGQRVYRSFGRLGRIAFKKGPNQISVSEFLELLGAYLKHNGWGVMRIDTSHLTSHGVLLIELANSIFSDALGGLRERVDYMLAGMFAALFSELSRSELACVEIGSPLTGDAVTTFLLSAKTRMEDIRRRADAGEPRDELVRAVLH
jgi:predicted hydrocarbon binding protein